MGNFAGRCPDCNSEIYDDNIDDAGFVECPHCGRITSPYDLNGEMLDYI